MAVTRICSIPGCGNTHLARGWCNAHYRRWQQWGDPLFLLGRAHLAKARIYFEETVLHFEGDECLIWPFARSRAGYAVLEYNGRLSVVSRLACEAANGPPPSTDHLAAHNCGHGHLGCVNKAHMRWATQTENMADTLIHGTRYRGEKHAQTHLTEADVRTIRALGDKERETDLAARFKISRGAVRHIKQRTTWAWLP